MSDQYPEEKEYDLEDRTLTFVEAKDSLNPYCELQAAAMSCGHPVTAESLTRWFSGKMTGYMGQYKFKCPAFKKDGKPCDAEWDYAEVRRLALLTPEEMRKFEKIMEAHAAKQICNYKACPGCKTFVEREAFDNLCFICTICKESNKPNQQFCWQCLRPWKGRAPRSDRCDNDGCSDMVLELLEKCGTMTLQDVRGMKPVPSFRVCPNCGIKVQHNQKGCKYVECLRCHVEFCYACLKLKDQCCSNNASYFGACSIDIAPRQTVIPIWNGE